MAPPRDPRDADRYEAAKGQCRQAKTSFTKAVNALVREIATYREYPSENLQNDLYEQKKAASAKKAIIEDLYEACAEYGHKDDEADWEAKTAELETTYGRMVGQLAAVEAELESDRRQRNEPQMNIPRIPIAANMEVVPGTFEWDWEIEEFENWQKDLKQYFANNYTEEKGIPHEISILRKYTGADVYRSYNEEGDQKKGVLEEGGALSYIMKEYKRKFPLFKRRTEFMDFEVGQNSDINKWLVGLASKARHAEVNSMQGEDVVVFKAIQSCPHADLKKKLKGLEEQEKAKGKTVTFESVKEMSKDFASTLIIQKEGKVNAVKSQKPGKKITPKNGKYLTRDDINGFCFCCGSDQHIVTKCTLKKRAKCKGCGGKGHFEQVCLAEYNKKKATEKEGGGEKKKEARTRKVSASDIEDEEEQ